MKAKWILLGSSLVAALACGVSASEGQLSNEGTAHVFVEVNPTIAIGVPEPHVNLGSVGTGIVTGTITFRIDANTERVKMHVQATNLCKGDQPRPLDGLPLYEIPVTGQGALVEPESAGPLAGGSNLLDWASMAVEDTSTGWKWSTSQCQVFDSSQGGHFSQGVDVTVQWDQSDAELPLGEYSGFVKLVAEIVMPGMPS